MPDRISSLDADYVVGDLSVFPEAIDDRETLYDVRNNAVTTLKQSLPFNGKTVIVKDASTFPSQGLLRIGPPPGESGNAELLYYESRTSFVFKNLVRGFAGSRQNPWPAGSWVTNSVMAEHHNAVKDALINLQTKLGLEKNPAATSINGILKSLENRYLAPRPSFRAFPLKGPPPLQVRFQNFSDGDIIRFLWDFNGEARSVEENPFFTFQREGVYTIKLNVITSTGAQGVATKLNYITVSEDEAIPFFYVVRQDSTKPAYSVETAASVGGSAATFDFVDQTDGDVLQRFWVFGDGENESQFNPNIHSTTHVYDKPGTYEPTLIVVFADERLKRVFLQEELVVL